MRLLPPPLGDDDPVSHFLASVKDLFKYALQNASNGDIVGNTINNEVNQNEKPLGVSFRRKDQLSGDVMWSVFEKVSQSNSRFKAMDTLLTTVHSVKVTAGFGGAKTMGRSIEIMAYLKKKSIVEVDIKFVLSFRIKHSSETSAFPAVIH